MEATIELAFHDLDTSSDIPAIKQGLDRVDALVADICMSGSAAYSQNQRRANGSYSSPGSSSSGNSNGQNSYSSPSTASESSETSSQLFHSAVTSSATTPPSAGPTSPTSIYNDGAIESRAHIALSSNPKYTLFYTLQNDVSYNIASRLLTILRHLLITYKKNMLDLYAYDDELAQRESHINRRHTTIGTMSTGIGGTGGTQRHNPIQDKHVHPTSKGLGLGDPNSSFGTINSDAYLEYNSDGDDESEVRYSPKKKAVHRGKHSIDERGPLKNVFNSPLSSSECSTNSDDERDEPIGYGRQSHKASRSVSSVSAASFGSSGTSVSNAGNGDCEDDNGLDDLYNYINDTAQLLLSLESMALQTLDLLQGTFLLHAPSRALCASKSNMLLLLELVFYDKQVAAQVATSDTPHDEGTIKSVRSMASGVSRVSGISAMSGVSERSNMARILSDGKTNKTSSRNSSHDHRSPSSKTASNNSNTSKSKANSKGSKDPNSLVIMYAPALQIAGISTLVSSMVHEPRTIRMFELCDGVATMCKLFKPKETPKNVKLRILEFLFFYLIPETKRSTATSAVPAAAAATGGDAGTANCRMEMLTGLKQKKTTYEKSKALRKWLGNVDGLIAELESSKPFGDLDHVEW